MVHTTGPLRQGWLVQHFLDILGEPQCCEIKGIIKPVAPTKERFDLGPVHEECPARDDGKCERARQACEAIAKTTAHVSGAASKDDGSCLRRS